MIPHKLRLHHFMCYREEQSLDFSGIHMACLAGDNGHGKSTLLDAMTWALWGQARARRDDELITLGEIEMWVSFEFLLGGRLYRIWRQRSSKGRGRSDLHFYVRDEGTNDWQLLDEGGLRERQAQIIRILRMDYETFVNSAFLLQGRADSFTVKTPGERKQILADILGLSRYDQYEARAKEGAAARKTRASRIEGEIAAIDADLARRPEFETRLAAALAKVAQASTQLAAAEERQAQAQKVMQEAQAQRRQLDDLGTRLARTERDLAEGREQLVAAQERLAQFEMVLADRADIEAGWAKLEAARQDEKSWNERLLHHTALQEALNRARRVVDQARLALEAERQRLADRHAVLSERVAAGEQQASILAEVQAILDALAVKQARRDAIARELQEIGERLAMLRSENDRLRIEGNALNEKRALLEDAETAACPLCGQPLAADHREEMLADFAAQRAVLAERYSENNAEQRILTERRTALGAEEAELARALRVWDARQRQAAQAEAVVADARVAAEEAALCAEQIAALDARPAAGEYASKARGELERLERELAAVGYDADAHQAVRSALAELERFAVRYQRELLPALDGLAEAKERVETLAAQQARREEELAADQAIIEQLADAVAALPQLEATLRQAEREVEAAMAAERRAHQEEGAAMQQLDALDVLTEKRSRRLAELEKVNFEFGLFNELREAFGKKGLQAMIIESVIPEVEVEANRLLNRMSEGRMSLRLETQREKVTGGVAETLDIIISDELGARAYEMYSGGESFRANLALRIAISKLLARRAGAQLQTLVIDEGFGTQDARGRQLLVEAINSIRDDFERILVITHIEELRDMFESRIDVVKTAGGSQVTIA